MAYAVAADVTPLIKMLQTGAVTNDQITAFIQKVTDLEINPILSSMYDITSTEVTTSKFVKELTAMGAALMCIEFVYGSNQRSELKSDIEKTKETYDKKIIQLQSGRLKI